MKILILTPFINPNINEDIFINPNPSIPVEPKPQVPVEPKPQVPVQPNINQQINTYMNSEVPVTIPITVPTPTPIIRGGFPILPLFPDMGGGGGSSQVGKRTKYVDELEAGLSLMNNLIGGVCRVKVPVYTKTKKASKKEVIGYKRGFKWSKNLNWTRPP